MIKTLSFFIFISLLLWPLMQEYFDPYIILFSFLLFNFKFDFKLYKLTGAFVYLIIFLTEVTSNVATTSTFLPVFGAVAVAVGVAPEVLTVPVVLAASCAFMLPVATPPNAIVYGANKFKIIDMMRAGFFINIAGIFVVTVFAYYFAKVIF